MRNFSPAVLALLLTTSLGAHATVEPGGSRYGDYLSAEMAANHHDMVGASRLYKLSLEQDPNNPELLNHAVFFAAGAGDLDQAIMLAGRIIKTTPDDRTARLMLAVAAFKQGDYREARLQLAQSGKGPAAELLLYLLDAWASQGIGDTKQALADLQLVTSEGGPATVLASYNRALVLDLANQPADADAAYKESLAASGHAARLVESYGSFLERQGRADDARAFYASLGGDAGLAQIAARGLERIAAGRKPERVVNSASDGAGEVLSAVATLLKDQVNADISTLYLRTALYLVPHDDFAKLVLADRLESVERVDDAIAVYHGVDSDSVYSQVALIQAAIDESRLDRNDAAIADMKTFTAAHPDNVEGWSALGEIYRAAEKYTDAVAAYDHAIKLRTPPAASDWELYYQRGAAQESAKNWSAAEADLLESLKLSPDQSGVLNYLGYSWIDQNRRVPEAIAMLEKARALSPFDGYIVDSVGWAYYRQGRYGDAAKTLLEAVNLIPGDATINEHLGDAYWKVGRKLDARFQWNHALAFGPSAAQKTKLEEKLKDGLGGGRS